MLKHLLGHVEIGDHTVFQRPGSANIAGRAAEHLLGFSSHGGHLLRPTRSALHPHRNN